MCFRYQIFLSHSVVLLYRKSVRRRVIRAVFLLYSVFRKDLRSAVEVEDDLRADLETLRRCIIKGNVEGAKEVIFEYDREFKLSLIGQRVNQHMSAMRKNALSTAQLKLQG